MATSKRITAPRNPGRVESVNLASYVPKSYREGTQGDWVNYGDDNLYPQYLVDLYHASPTHNALCTTIAMMIFGEGFEPADLNAKLLAAQWDLDSELRLEFHHEFNEVEAVGFQVLLEAGFGGDLCSVDRQHIDGTFGESLELFLAHVGPPRDNPSVPSRDHRRRAALHR